jgi:hypothetical protein
MGVDTTPPAAIPRDPFSRRSDADPTLRRATGSSTSVFHSPHASHRPVHFADSAPHSEHRYTDFAFATLAVCYRLRARRGGGATGVALEPRVLLVEEQIDRAHGTVALLADDHLGFALE